MRAVEVRLWKTRIGVVAIEEDSKYCTFKYDSEFIKSGIEVSPIMMPLSENIYQFKALSLESFKGLPGLISDSLPDKYGNAIINAWLATQGRTAESFNVIDRLCYIGTRGMGAMEYFPDMNKELKESDEIEINQLVELSNQILNDKENITIQYKDNMKDIVKVGTSAGGARAKAIIAFNQKTGVIRSGQIDAGKGYSYWILKLDGVDQKEESSHTRIEYAYYLMAKEAHINMTESRLIKRDKYYHFMTKRFDRIELEDGSIDKVHMQTLGALMHRDYNEPGTLSYEEATQAMYAINLSKDDIEEFFRRMVFNVMSRNQDDHVKNISFLMNRRGKWVLSPAYDITYSFNPNGQWTAVHQMMINRKRNNISKEDLLQSAKAMRINASKALDIISDVSMAIQKWRVFATEASIDGNTIEMIEGSFIKYK
jgi:serine/threonine-protein kinase HipA